MKQRLWYVILIVIVLMIGYFLGYSMGLYNGVKLVIKLGAVITDIDVDEEMLAKGILQYKNNIGGCLFTKNASIYSDKGS